MVDLGVGQRRRQVVALDVHAAPLVVVDAAGGDDGIGAVEEQGGVAAASRVGEVAVLQAQVRAGVGADVVPVVRLGAGEGDRRHSRAHCVERAAGLDVDLRAHAHPQGGARRHRQRPPGRDVHRAGDRQGAGREGRRAAVERDGSGDRATGDDEGVGPVPGEGQAPEGRRHVEGGLVERDLAIALDAGVLDDRAQACTLEVNAAGGVVSDRAVPQDHIGGEEVRRWVAAPARGGEPQWVRRTVAPAWARRKYQSPGCGVAAEEVRTIGWVEVPTAENRPVATTSREELMPKLDGAAGGDRQAAAGRHGDRAVDDQAPGRERGGGAVECRRRLTWAPTMTIASVPLPAMVRRRYVGVMSMVVW